jgi:putative transposase
MKPVLSIGEYYHIYNRGTDKRDVFLLKVDMERFFLCMREFNITDATGGIFKLQHSKSALRGLTSQERKPLVEFVAYCLNSNHYHFVLKQLVEKGIENFMQRIGTGYTMYFNEKNERSGSLFQGTYKAKHIATNEYLLYVTTYTNLNFVVHQPLRGLTSQTEHLYMSSWDEYLGKGKRQFCAKNVILGQFSSIKSFKAFSEDTLKSIMIKKENEKELRNLLLEV